MGRTTESQNAQDPKRKQQRQKRSSQQSHRTPASPPQAEILTLQETAGNQATNRALRSRQTTTSLPSFDSKHHEQSKSEPQWEAYQIPIGDLDEEKLNTIQDIDLELTLRLFKLILPKYSELAPSRQDMIQLYRDTGWNIAQSDEAIRQEIRTLRRQNQTTLYYRSRSTDISLVIERYEHIRQARVRRYYRALDYRRESPAGRLALDLLKLIKQGNYDAVQQALDRVDWSDRDDVILELIQDIDDALLDQIAQQETGRRLLDRFFDDLTEGYVAAQETVQADRVIRTKARLIPNHEFEQASRSATKLFPFKSSGLFVLNDSPIQAERRSNGKIWVKLMSRVGGTDQFAEEVKTLPSAVFSSGIELPENEIIGVKMYDLGGEIHYRPALYLVQLAHESTTKTLLKIAEVSSYAATLGSGALVGLGLRKSLATQILVWTERFVFGLETITLVLREHRGWIIEQYGEAGKEFLRYVDLVNSATAIYGVVRLAGMERLMNGLEAAHQRWLKAVQGSKLSKEQRQAIQQVNQHLEDVLDSAAHIRQTKLQGADAEAASEAIPPAKPPTKPLDHATENPPIPRLRRSSSTITEKLIGPQSVPTQADLDQLLSEAWRLLGGKKRPKIVLDPGLQDSAGVYRWWLHEIRIATHTVSRGNLASTVFHEAWHARLAELFPNLARYDKTWNKLLASADEIIAYAIGGAARVGRGGNISDRLGGMVDVLLSPWAAYGSMNNFLEAAPLVIREMVLFTLYIQWILEQREKIREHQTPPVIIQSNPASTTP